MQRRLTRLRQSHVVKQVVTGREFKGQPFRVTPEVVVFKVCPFICFCTLLSFAA